MMIRTVSPGKPVELLRSSSEQIRRAAELLAEIADESELRPQATATPPGPDPGETAARREQVIRTAQRSFAAALRLAQEQERPEDG